MTTTSRSQVLLVKPDTQMFVEFGAIAVFMALGAVYWDITWHGTIGRDSFWIPPHLVVYTSVTAFLLAALGGFALAWQRAGSLQAALTTRTGMGFAVAALGQIIQIAAAPLDDLWHRLYGLDVTIWSPPHLMIITGGIVGIYGMIAALGIAASGWGVRPRWRGIPASERLALVLFGAALVLALVALNEMEFHLDQRDVLGYPLLAGTLAAVPLMGAARVVNRPGAATVVALVYMIFRTLVLLMFWAMGVTAEHMTPPVFALAPALAIDLALWRTNGRGALIAALLSGPALLFGEWGYRPVFGAAAWQPLEVFASLAVITLVVALAGLAGDRLGSVLRVEEAETNL